MIDFLQPYFEHSDDRGSLRGLTNSGEWREVNMIFSDQGSERGNHYHKHTHEMFIIITGRVKVVFQEVVDDMLVGEAVERHVTGGDVFVIPPGTNHVFFCEEDSQWINLLSVPMDQEDPDLHRPVA